MGGCRGVPLDTRLDPLPAAVWNALLAGWLARACLRIGLSRSRHPDLRRAEPAIGIQDPRQPPPRRARRLCGLRRLCARAAAGDHRLMSIAARLRKASKLLIAALILLVVLLVLPVLFIEITCRGDAEPAVSVATSARIAPAAQRPEVNSYLSYPEWYIVHTYEDFASVLATHDEYAFGYLASIGGFWSCFCSLNRLVSGRGATPLDTKVMLYTIGVSFTGELAVKGLYETTIGYLTVAMRGDERTAEDRFARTVAEDYARFLRQTP